MSVFWVSKLQTKIALSTTESDYIALYEAMRDVLPLRCLIEELARYLDVKRRQHTTMTTVWDDNNAYQLLAFQVTCHQSHQETSILQ
jgi:hypothetical protein